MSHAVRLAALILLLAAPTAQAKEVFVDPKSPPDPQVDAADPGDTVVFRPGNHIGAVSVEDADITLRGEPGALVAVTEGTAPVISFTGANGKVHDLTVVTTVGDGVVFGPGATELKRSIVVSTAKKDPFAAAVRADSGSAAGAKSLTVDSSALRGQTSISSSYATPTAAGAGVTIAARHVTAIGPIVANTSGATPSALPGLGSQPITVTFTDSIVMGGRIAVAGDNRPEAKIDTATRNLVADTDANASKYFVRPASFNYRLRADAQDAIDKGGMSSGESATDLKGGPRVAGPASDLGADEFVNRAPTASLSGPAAVRQNVAVTFSAAGSSDPDAAIGGGIASYRWDFGDGTTTETTTPTISHAFPERKQYSVTVTVTDANGGTATSSPVTFTVADGSVPTSATQQPGPKERLRLYNKKGKRRGVTFFGLAEDDTGLAGVFLALRPVASRNGVCRWFDGKSKLVSTDCTKPVLLQAKVTGTSWRYKLPKRARLPKGPYRLLVVPVDTSGLPGATETIDFRFL